MPMLAPWVESHAWVSARAAVVPLQNWVEARPKCGAGALSNHQAPLSNESPKVAPYRSTRDTEPETILLQPPDPQGRGEQRSLPFSQAIT